MVNYRSPFRLGAAIIFILLRVQMTLSMEEILDFLNLIYPLSPACIDYLKNVVKMRRVAKNEVVLAIGDVNRNLYFIKTGALHCY